MRDRVASTTRDASLRAAAVDAVHSAASRVKRCRSSHRSRAARTVLPSSSFTDVRASSTRSEVLARAAETSSQDDAVAATTPGSPTSWSSQSRNGWMYCNTSPEIPGSWAQASPPVPTVGKLAAQVPSAIRAARIDVSLTGLPSRSSRQLALRQRRTIRRLSEHPRLSVRPVPRPWIIGLEPPLRERSRGETPAHGSGRRMRRRVNPRERERRTLPRQSQPPAETRLAF